MRALDRKVLRDLARMRGQVLAVALVIASGVAVLVMSLSTLDALRETTRAYYERYRFAQVFAALERAPEHGRGPHRGHRAASARSKPVSCATRRSTSRVLPNR